MPHQASTVMAIPDAPPLLLIIPEHRLEGMAADKSAAIVGCEAAYHSGVYYVTVPCDVYSRWPRATVAAAAPGSSEKGAR